MENKLEGMSEDVLVWLETKVFRPLICVARIAKKLGIKVNFELSSKFAVNRSFPVKLLVKTFNLFFAAKLLVDFCDHATEDGSSGCCKTVYYKKGLRRRRIVSSRGRSYPEKFTFSELQSIGNGVPLLVQQVLDQLGSELREFRAIGSLSDDGLGELEIIAQRALDPQATASDETRTILARITE